MAFFLDNREEDTIPHLLDEDTEDSSIMVLAILKKPTPKQRSRSLTQSSPVMKEITRSSSLSHITKEMYSKIEKNKRNAEYATKIMDIFGQDREDESRGKGENKGGKVGDSDVEGDDPGEGGSGEGDKRYSAMQTPGRMEGTQEPKCKRDRYCGSDNWVIHY